MLATLIECLIACRFACLDACLIGLIDCMLSCLTDFSLLRLQACLATFRCLLGRLAQLVVVRRTILAFGRSAPPLWCATLSGASPQPVWRTAILELRRSGQPLGSGIWSFWQPGPLGAKRCSARSWPRRGRSSINVSAWARCTAHRRTAQMSLS